MNGTVYLPKFEDFKVKVIMGDDAEYPQNGKIIFVDSSEDNLTSSVSIKAEISSDENQKILLPGQFVRVKLIGAEYKNALLVPSSALLSTRMGYSVYSVKEDNVVELRPVKAEVIGNYGLIESGLKEGETVIFEGLVKARPGMRVNVALKTPEIAEQPKK
jgi:membrane fusion protein (multidrug efflux system)